MEKRCFCVHFARIKNIIPVGICEFSSNLQLMGAHTHTNTRTHAGALNKIIYDYRFVFVIYTWILHERSSHHKLKKICLLQIT